MNTLAIAAAVDDTCVALMPKEAIAWTLILVRDRDRELFRIPLCQRQPLHRFGIMPYQLTQSIVSGADGDVTVPHENARSLAATIDHLTYQVLGQPLRTAAREIDEHG